jgi:hypothetical protein
MIMKDPLILPYVGKSTQRPALPQLYKVIYRSGNHKKFSWTDYYGLHPSDKAASIRAHLEQNGFHAEVILEGMHRKRGVPRTFASRDHYFPAP